MKLLRRLSTILKYLLIFALAATSMEILWRRWVMHQIPTQVDAIYVYGLVILNLLSISLVLRRASKLKTLSRPIT